MIEEDSKNVSKSEVKKANKPEQKQKLDVDKNDKPLKKAVRVRIYLISSFKFFVYLNY